MYYRILHATDLSENAKTLARKAWEIATHFDGRLYLVHVIEPVPIYGYAAVTELELAQIEQAKKALAEIGKEYMVPAENQFILVGPTKTEILTKAKDLKVDLIVVGTHGRHGISRLLGSTASAIIHGAACDVITIRVKE